MSATQEKAARMGRAVIRSQVIGPLAILVVLGIVASLSTSTFLREQNLRNLAYEMAIVAVIAIGSTLVILTAQIDLSPGAIVGLTSMTTAVLLVNDHVAIVPTFLLILVFGAGLGLVNGFFSSYGRIPSFIFTLATMSAYQGIAFEETGGTPIFSLPGIQPFFYNKVAGIPLPFVYVVLLYVAAWSYLRYTKGGRRIYAVGGNDSAARLVGVKVNRVRMKVFVAAGVLAAFAGLLMSAQLDSGDPGYGQGLELQAIAAAVIGGASLFGGQGNVIATFFGAAIIAVIQNVLNLHSVGTAWQNITTGAIIAAAVGIDMWRSDMARAAAARWRSLRGLQPVREPIREEVSAGSGEREREQTRT